jgi:hypothetical protein
LERGPRVSQLGSSRRWIVAHLSFDVAPRC